MLKMIPSLNTKYLNDDQLKRLKDHKYSAEGTSVIEPIMQVFWRWIVEKIPLWWAPNAMTLVGLIINIATTGILFIYSPDAISEAPSWAYLICAVGLFIYQTLDATDGKQARRTNSSSPLGELFDHGCDSVSMVFVVLGLATALQLGKFSDLLYFQCITSMFIFYAAHWQTYCTGTLMFGRIDVTEAQFTAMFIYVLTAIFGPGIWSTKILGMQLNAMFIFGVFISAIGCCFMYFNIILMRGGKGKNGSTVADTSVLSPMCPIAILLILSVIIWKKSTTQVYEANPIFYLFTFGVIIAKTTNKLVVAHMTKSEMDLFDMSLLGPFFLISNQYFDNVFDEYLILCLALVYSILDLLIYSTSVCQQIARYLDIRVFSIRKLTD